MRSGSAAMRNSPWTAVPRTMSLRGWWRISSKRSAFPTACPSAWTPIGPNTVYRTAWVAKRNSGAAFLLPIMREALSRGDVGKVSEIIEELLDRHGINLDRDSLSYRKVGLAVLKAEVRALEALLRRAAGEVVETPPIVEGSPHEAPLAPIDPIGGRVKGVGTSHTLRDAFAGWQREKERGAAIVGQYGRVCDQFIQLHGNLSWPVLHATTHDASEKLSKTSPFPVRRSSPGPRCQNWSNGAKPIPMHRGSAEPPSTR